ncbi:MAG: hypothetical protein Tsb0020_23990 [Haliangiales bacterium]
MKRLMLVLGLSLAIYGCAHRQPAEPAAGGAAALAPEEIERQRGAVAAVLDDFHAAAAAADEARYLGHLAADSVFLGTDASERWTKPEFQAFVRPHFARGQGWEYRPRDRHISLSARADVAWFDELLDHDRYGELRGTGALRRGPSGWKLLQYNLTFTVPNQVGVAVVELIQSAGDAPAAAPDAAPDTAPDTAPDATQTPESEPRTSGDR